MLIVEIGAVWATLLAALSPSWFGWLIVFWLWLTVVFANLAEAVAEGRGKAQAESLRKTKADTMLAGSPMVTKNSWPRRYYARATSSWSRPARSSPVTVTCWKGLPRWTNPPSPANPPR